MPFGLPAAVVPSDRFLLATPDATMDEQLIHALGPSLWFEAQRALYWPPRGAATWDHLLDRQRGLEIQPARVPLDLPPGRLAIGDDWQVLQFDHADDKWAARCKNPLTGLDPDVYHPTVNTWAWLSRIQPGMGGIIFGSRAGADGLAILVDAGDAGPGSGVINVWTQFTASPDSTTAAPQGDGEWHVNIVSMDAGQGDDGTLVHRVDGVVANAGYTIGARPLTSNAGGRKMMLGATDPNASSFGLTADIAAGIILAGTATHQTPVIQAAIERRLTAIKTILEAAA